MNSSFIQKASLTGSGNQKKLSFVNLSSQQMNPGLLNEWFAAQNSAMQPMPFTNDDIPVSQMEIRSVLSEKRNNVSELDRQQKIDTFFRENAQENRADFRTNSQKAWGVPLAYAEARATELL